MKKMEREVEVQKLEAKTHKASSIESADDKDKREKGNGIERFRNRMQKEDRVGSTSGSLLCKCRKKSRIGNSL